MMGTLNYMAPEQMQGKPIDARCDMFSAGAVFYEILAGRHAFPGDAQRGVDNILHKAPESLEKACPGIHPLLVGIVDRCLAKQPEDRYADLLAVKREIATVRQRLKRAEHDSDATIVTPLPAILTSEPSGPSQPPRPSTSNRTKWVQLRNEQIQAHVAEARQAFERGDDDAALSACEKALGARPGKRRGALLSSTSARGRGRTSAR